MTANPSWLGKSWSTSTLDSYDARERILRALLRALPQFNGVLLDVGSGHMPLRAILTAPPSRVVSYVGLDLEQSRYSTKPDLTWDGVTMPLRSGSVQSALLTEVLEHCPDPGGVLTEVGRVLAPGGFLFLTVPFIWPLHDVPDDMYRFTPFSLERHLMEAGFERIEVDALGGWDASLAQMLGLWIRRRPMGKLQRVVFSLVGLPIVKLLSRLDRTPPGFGESQMVSALSATALRSRF